jgi:hypothetical protein
VAEREVGEGSRLLCKMTGKNRYDGDPPTIIYAQTQIYTYKNKFSIGSIFDEIISN